MTAALAWLGVILLAWVAGCAVLWALYLRHERALSRAAAEAAAARLAGEQRRAREQARDECAADAIARYAALVDEEYRALCEREGGRG